jgi:dTDP-4-dehydrorhamnose reductase
MSNVIVFGASGLLGASLVPVLQACGYTVLTQSRAPGADLSLDPSDHGAVAAALARHRPSAVINLVAATNVDQCEVDTELAWQANVGVVAAIVEGILALGNDLASRPHLVHISTDQVYDGPGPHSEDWVHPINVYGLSKYTGELLAERVGATVLRSNFYGRSRASGRMSFSDWLVRSLQEKTPITVFEDVKFSAIHIDTLCDFIVRSIVLRPAGIFNAGCRDGISKAGFAMALAGVLGLPTENVRMGTSADVALKARRPLDMTLKVARLEAAFDLQCPDILNEIEHTSKEYLNDCSPPIWPNAAAERTRH